MNNQHPSITSSIIKSLSKLREDQEFEDFIVKMNDDVIPCHSFILASCSEFFRCLLRTNMKEKQEMKVELKNISSSTFKLIVNTLYTGCELLTKENVLEVWSAVHQLQIQFLIEHCEDFVIANLSLETVEDYKQKADYLNSVKVCQYIHDFICRNFNQYQKTESMLRMKFQDFIEIVKSDKLNVTSEDEVLYSIYDWVSYSDSSTYNGNADFDANQTSGTSQSSGNKTTGTSQSSEKKTACTFMSSGNDRAGTSHSFTSDTASISQTFGSKTEGELEISASETAEISQKSVQQPFSSESCSVIKTINGDTSTQYTGSSMEKQLLKSDNSTSDRNERKSMLVYLLKSTRYCLASRLCISQLYEALLTQDNLEVKDILFKALFFKTSRNWIANYPTAAIHRDCSNLIHVGLYCNSDKIKALNFKEDKWISIQNLPTQASSSNPVYQRYLLTVSGGELYAFVGNKGFTNTVQMIKFTTNNWKIVTDLQLPSCALILSNDEYIYTFSGRNIFSFNPYDDPITVKKFSVKILNITYALAFYSNILLFGTSIAIGDETIVYFYKTKTNENKKLKNIKFASKNMTSFRDDINTYILDSNGNLLKLINSRNIEFTFVAKLWSETFVIKGALLFRETLFIFTASLNKIDVLDRVDGVYSSVKIKEVTNDASNIVYFVK